MLRGAFRYYSLFSKKKNFQSDKSIKHILYLKTLIVGTSKNIFSRTRGTVSFVDDAGTIHPIWDNGRTFGVIVGQDNFRKLPQSEIEAEQHSNHLSDAGIVIFTTVPPPSRGEITILPLHIISSLCLILFRAICGSWSPAELKPEPSSSTIISLPPFV